MIKLTKKQARIYKQRWEQVELVNVQELQTTPMPLKFKQLCLLMNSFHPAPTDKKDEREISKIRQRWITLKRRWEHDHS